MSYYTNNSSPPPLQHPVPTHPAYIPEPPSTPMSPQGYQRYTSSPPAPNYAQPMPPAGHSSHLSPPYASGNHYQPAPHQPHLQGQINASGPVDFSAWGLDNATAAFGMQLGQSAVAAGQEYVQKNVRSSSSSIAAIHSRAPSARRFHPHLHAQAPFQCLKFLRRQQASPPSLPLETQALVTPRPTSRKWPVRVVSASRRYQFSRSLHPSSVLFSLWHKCYLS